MAENEKILDIPKSDRPREKMLSRGAGALNNSELLAILLRTGIKGVSAINLAKQMLEQYGSLNGLGNLSLNELARIKGLGTAKAAQLGAAFELGKRLARENIAGLKLNSAEIIYQLVSPEMQNLSKEVVRVVLLNTRLRLIKIEDISIGSLDMSIAHPREILRPAIIHNAHSFVLLHNHPSGNPNPSNADRELTKKIQQASEILELKFRDHIIIGHPSQNDKAYYSFCEMGNL